MTAANDTTPLPCFGFTAETWRDRSNAARKPWGIFLGDILVSVEAYAAHEQSTTLSTWDEIAAM